MVFINDDDEAYGIVRRKLLEPGVVSSSRWRSEATPFGEHAEVAIFGGVGRER